jgi:uncharacterized protein YeaO (DUF488 family)
MTGKLTIKRVYDPPEPGDGKRILVDRLWPRGLKRDAAALDAWIKDVAPSADLRRWFGHRPERWAEFARRYRHELAAEPASDALRKIAALAARDRVTLVYGARDRDRNQAVVIAEAIAHMRTSPRS